MTDDELYQRRKTNFAKAKAEWIAQMKELPEKERYMTAQLERAGYLLVYVERDPLKRQALLDWLDEPSLPN
jgi:hypothetical protein